MSWSPATSQVRRHIAHCGFDAQKYWVICYSPGVALDIIFPRLLRKCLICGTEMETSDHYHSFGFARLQECDSPRTDNWFFSPIWKDNNRVIVVTTEPGNSFSLSWSVKLHQTLKGRLFNLMINKTGVHFPELIKYATSFNQSIDSGELGERSEENAFYSWYTHGKAAFVLFCNNI